MFPFLLSITHAGPSISGISPASGPAGTVITIKGAGFTGATNVTFNGSVPFLGDFTVTADTNLLVVVPLQASTGTLTVYTPGGSATSGVTFTAAPVITSFSPPNGGNPTAVYINGANFVVNGTTVTFSGASPVAGTVTASTVVEATVPAGAVTGPITVTTSAGSAVSASNFVASSTPAITGFNPPYGSIGSSVTISGWNFYGVTSVKFNGTTASFSTPSQTQITATVPAGATSGQISVTTAAGTAMSGSNYLTGAGPFITSFSPPLGTLNNYITLYGLNLATTDTVSFDGVKEAVTGYGTGYLQINLNAATATGPIEITGAPGQNFTTSSNFIYASGPYVTGFSPTLGGAGIYVVIDGYNFSGVSSVKFGGASASFSITSSNQITATVPSGAGTGAITVGSFTTSSNFTVEGTAPVVTSFSPTNAVTGSVVTINGANFTNLSSPGVEFNGVGGAYATPTSTTTLYGTVPVGATTGPVSVKNNNGTGSSSAMLYLQPWISNATPSGIVNSTLTINGRNLTNVSSLQIGAVNWSFKDYATQLVATVPSNAVSGPIVIASPGGVFINPASFVVLPKIYSFAPTLGPAGTVVTISGTSLYDVSSVLFNGVSAAPFNVTTNQLQAAVPTGATPGYITVVTAGGNDVSSNIFTATYSSTVVMTKTVKPPVAGPGTNVVYTIFLTNEGPSTVTSLSVTDNIPLGFNYISSSSSIGTAVFTNNSVVASIGILASNTSATVTVTGKSPNSGALTNTANLGFAEGNTIYGNNYAFAYAYFVTAAQRTLGIGQFGNGSNFDIIWPVSAASFVLQVNSNLDHSNGWQPVTGVFVTNGYNAYTNNFIGSPADFFRLIYP